MKKEIFRAVCLDHRTLMSAEAQNVTDKGCELVSEPNAFGPIFPLRARVLVNLLEEKSNRSMTYNAWLSSFKLLEGRWIYYIRFRFAKTNVG